MKSFENWEYEEVQKYFGIQRLKDYPLLNDWLTVPLELRDGEEKILERLRVRLLDHADIWNEDELKMFFISQLVDMVDFEQENYQPFSQRHLSAKIGELEVGGIVNFVVATGIQHPQRPFYCLHEYKQERKRERDPLGQLLMAMVVAQAKNQTNMPIYGTYIIGRNWFFVVLKDKTYATSDALIATRANEIKQIFAMLRQTKVYINMALQN